MKRSLLVFVCTVLLASLSVGQISISYSTFSSMFTTGGPIRFYVDTLSLQSGSINVGHKGGPQTFDFSGLTLFILGTDTIRLVSADPFLAARFDPANIQFKAGQNQQEYERPILSLQSSSMTQTGQVKYFGTDSIRVRHSSPSEPFLLFPITLGDSVQVISTHYDTTFVSGSPTTKSSESRTQTVVVDAYGTLLLPGGKSYACLRERNVESLPNNGKEFRFITETGGMLFVSSYNTEPDTGVVAMQDPIQYIINPNVTGVTKEEDVLPRTLSLGQNYPNPFNPSTTIRYELPASGMVRLSIIDLLGREVALLVNREVGPGFHSVTWNAVKEPSGVYFSRLEADGKVQIRKLVLIK